LEKEMESLLIIGQKDGLGPEFSKLVSMMDYARFTTIAEVKNLTVKELDFLYDEDANSIGMLLEHFAAVEKAYQIITFGNGDLTDEEAAALNPGLDLGKPAQEQIHGHNIDYYLNQLAEARAATIEKFKTLPDEWLSVQTPFWWDLPANNYFKWFHVFEDELNHRGQIRLIKKMIKQANQKS
jgi:uncharacterized damage-inducible protein DinB